MPGSSSAARRTRGVADAGDGNDPVAGPGEGGAEDRTDPAGADDADVEPRWALVGGSHGVHAIAGPARARFTLSLRCPHDADLRRRRYGVPVGGIGWREAWHGALYGPSGFYRAPSGPAGHFTTATHGPLGPVLAGALLQLAQDEACTRIVDVGCRPGRAARPRCAASTPTWPSPASTSSPGRGTCRAGSTGSPRREASDLPGRAGPPRRARSSSPTSGSTWCPAPSPRSTTTGCCGEVWVDPATGEESLGRRGRRRRARLGRAALGRRPSRASGSRSASPATGPGPGLAPAGRAAAWPSPWTTATAAATGPRAARSRHTGRGRWSPPCRTGPAT